MPKLTASALLMVLAACGQQSATPKSGDVASRHADACALITNPPALFGAGAQTEPDDGFDDMAGACRFTSADARRGGDVILYNAVSLGAVTPQAKLAEVIAQWSKSTYTPPALVEGLAEEASIVTDLPGQQVQLGLRKGAFVILIAGRSGDPAMSADALARAMAAQAGAAPMLK